ncbi:uncharacterized protein LOC110933303 [Helianthus annuus]|uniref:uncharacterized protein LOC110933303 n=1 Tax=Helianthus annuus TaxID=4232 RepID=UPI000B902B30|nr:uncharacterized protein LOC110933303 [Helianthus annuus]
MPYQPPPQARLTQIEEEDDDVEVVPETQAEPSKKKNTKGKGNNQASDGFWQETLDIFHAIMEQGEYKTVDYIGSKWRKMNTLIQRFCGFYNTTLANKPSGWNNENVFNEALRLYENENKTSFPRVRAWQIVKDHPKWKPEYDEEPIGEEERPPGRDKSKKIAVEKRKQAASGSGGGSKPEGIIAELKAFNQTFTETQTEKVKVKKRQAEEKKMRQEEAQQLEE